MSENAPEISACEAMIAAAVARPTSGKSAHAGASRKNGCCRRLRIAQEQRALTEVVEQQRRQHEREPGDANRPPAEMAHVGVERLAAGDDQEDGAEHGEAVPSVLAKERERMARIDRGEHDRLFDEPGDAERGDDQEPADHHRAEQPADAVGAVPLNREDADEDRHRDRHDVRLRTAASRP